jgi:hypothetical protein
MLPELDFVSASLNSIRLVMWLTFRSRLLVRHPPYMSRLQQEIANVMGSDTDPTKEHIRQMPFLNCVIKESK